MAGGRTVTVKPAPGLKVRDPTTFRFVAEEGETKPLDQYWSRRLRDGDVVLVKEKETNTWQ